MEIQKDFTYVLLVQGQATDELTLENPLSFTCDGCNSIYIGKTKRYFLVRAYEHLGLSYKTGNKLMYNPRNSNNTAVLNHINRSDRCCGTLDSFEIIGGARNDFFLRIKESLLIKKIKPTLINPNSQSVPLLLFD